VKILCKCLFIPLSLTLLSLSLSLSRSLSLSLSIYIYIYIYIFLEKERKRYIIPVVRILWWKPKKYISLFSDKCESCAVVSNISSSILDSCHLGRHDRIEKRMQEDIWWWSYILTTRCFLKFENNIAIHSLAFSLFYQNIYVDEGRRIIYFYDPEFIRCRELKRDLILSFNHGWWQEALIKLSAIPRQNVVSPPLAWLVGFKRQTLSSSICGGLCKLNSVTSFLYAQIGVNRKMKLSTIVKSF